MNTVFTKTLTVTALALSLLVTNLFPASAGAIGGRYSDTNYLYAGWERTYTISFYGNERASVAAVGDGDIDIYVYDAAGRLVAFDDDYDSEPVCSWTPRYDQTYKIKIVNDDDYTVDYSMSTN